MAKTRVLPTLLFSASVLVAAAAHAIAVGEVVCMDTRGFHDGDTFACVTEAKTFSVRVAGVDAPETGQAFWKVARELLRAQARPGTKVDCYKEDRYGRQVCRVSSPEGVDIAEELVQSGVAWHTVKYRSEQTAQEQARYDAAEAAARARGLGLWSQQDPQEPGECRERRRQRQKCR